MDLRRQGKDERALPFFQKAYAIEHTPRTAGQLGLSEMAVGYWLSAENHLTEALDSPAHPWISKNQKTLASALEQVRQKIGEVTINGSPTGARVVINGQDAGTLPLPAPVRVGEGRVQIELSAPGYASTVRTFRLNGGAKQQVALMLEPGPKPTGTSPATPSLVVGPRPWTGAPPSSGQDGTSPLPTSGREETTPPDNTTGAPSSKSDARDASAHDARRTIAFVAGGVAVAALVFGVVETIEWQKKQTEFSHHLGMRTPIADQTGCGEDDPGRGATGCAALYDAARRAWRWSLVGYGAGAALTAGALYLILSGDGVNAHADQQTGLQSLNCLPTMALYGVDHSRVLSCRLRF